MGKFTPFSDRSETISMLTGSSIAIISVIELVTSRSISDKNGMNTRKIDRYRQGINVKNLEYYFKSNLFRMPGDKFSDDNITGKDPHEIDERIFGQPKLFDSIQPFHDIPGRLDSGSVKFIEDPHVQIYPQVYFNPLMKDPDQMDGVIEPLAIREVIANRSIEAPFIAHSIKADLEAGNRENVKGADRVFQQIPLTASLQADPFLDEDGIVMSTKFGLTGSFNLAGPGFMSDIVKIINPFDDSRPLPEKLFAFSQIGSGSLTGSLSDRGLVDYTQKSATAGFIYDNVTEYGTDSIAYGGLFK